MAQIKAPMDLDVVLKNSFSAIKKDMQRISDKINSIKNDFDKLKDVSVTKDKLNSIKMKIGELNDSFRLFWDLKSKVEDIDNNSVKKQEFTKKIDEIVKFIKDIEEDYTSQLQVKRFIDDINKEFNVLRKEVRDEFNKVINEVEAVKTLKERIAYKEIAKITKGINKRLESFRDEIDRFEKLSKNYIKEKDVKKVINNFNKEINDIKSSINEISREVDIEGNKKRINKIYNKFNNEIKKINDRISSIIRNKTDKNIIESLVKKHGKEVFYDLADNINSKISNLKDDITNLKNEIKSIKNNFVKENKLNGLKNEITNLSNNFVDKKSFNSEAESIRRQIRLLNKRFRLIKGYKVIKSGLIIANILLFLSFLSIVFAIVTFFIKISSFFIPSIVVAVVFFIMGIVSRIMLTK